MKKRILALLFSMFVTPFVAADVQDTEMQRQFFLPKSGLRISIPKDDWSIHKEVRRSDGDAFYYLLSSKQHAFQFSILAEKTDKCNSGEGCRSYFWSHRGASLTDPKNVHLSVSNGFHIVEFYVGRMGSSTKQTNVSAHMYRDGYWIDIHGTVAGEDILSSAPMLRFIELITVN